MVALEYKMTEVNGRHKASIKNTEKRTKGEGRLGIM
jgi:hypothetical protein